MCTNTNIIKSVCITDHCVKYNVKQNSYHHYLWWLGLVLTKMPSNQYRKSYHGNKMIVIILTYWGQVTHICVSKLTVIGSDNGLSPDQRQAIIWTSAGILSIGPPGTHFNEILIEIHTFSFKKMHLKMSSGKWRPFCVDLNVLTIQWDLLYW